MAQKDQPTSPRPSQSPACLAVDATTVPDSDLMLQVQVGDEDAFAVLFTRYHREIRAFIAARLGGDLSTADDITSEVFTKVFRFRNRFHGGSFRGWLYQIARNAIVDHHRAHRDIASIDGETDLASTAPAPDAQAITSEARDNLFAALSTLSPVPRRIVELRLKGYPLDAICADLNMELSAVKSAQHRAFKRLRHLLHTPLAELQSDRSPRA